MPTTLSSLGLLGFPVSKRKFWLVGNSDNQFQCHNDTRSHIEWMMQALLAFDYGLIPGLALSAIEQGRSLLTLKHGKPDHEAIEAKFGVIVNASETKAEKKPKSVNINGIPTRVLLIRNMFERLEETTKALIDLDGCFFGGRTVHVTFYDEERFGKNELAPIPGEVPGYIPLKYNLERAEFFEFMRRSGRYHRTAEGFGYQWCVSSIIVYPCGH
ncbi:hypothetical protein IFM89_030493 [Coptis chinensis]|uniref:Uncharacterized protein n=1 Tax=Coptis chinensis TaxID=261450 RepID=A0A835H9D2_9MAGN|nr:hypothetical protein IFM89_030493 [Coptis chinensis]